ncbi:class I SAM-dependent methyltransferase [Phenylobacterium sp.]|uniref:class I SAM-dependent methyltransferase n=1 Tax=Phenylobacterium sp. TaxID=1871053 RepID=UPI0035AEB580
MSLQDLLKNHVRHGALSVRLPGGARLELGDGTGPRIAASLTDPLWCARVAARPALAAGEAYMAGALTVEEGGLYALMDLMARSFPVAKPAGGALGRWWLDRRMQANSRRASRRNVAHHYDLSTDFYRRFLDEDMQYSCAYFARPEMTLEEAQAAKKRHIAAKLRLEPGQRVLDIGCGWGGLALSLASYCPVDVDGVTLSQEQLALARARAADARMEEHVRFFLTDYRDVRGRYDRIVSVGMFEHVGRPNYQAYFDAVAAHLADDGVAVIHSIGRSDGPDVTQPWIAKYIFPGGYIPALSEVLPAVERAGLVVADIEILRLHYAETLKRWRARFMARRAEIARLYDERFCRMWEFYLVVSELAFRVRGHMVFQLQLARRGEAVPLTRDYIAEAERALEAPRRIAA